MNPMHLTILILFATYFITNKLNDSIYQLIQVLRYGIIPHVYSYM